MLYSSVRHLLSLAFRESSKKSSQPARRRFALEPLEQRMLLSGDVVLASGLLHVTGTEARDAALIQTLEAADGTPQVGVAINGDFFKFDLQDIEAIQVDLLGGDDSLTVEASFALPRLRIDAGAGNDAVGMTLANPDTGDRADRSFDVGVDLGDGDNLFEGTFADVRGDIALGAGGGTDIIRTTSTWTDHERNRHPDFLWSPTVVTGGGDDAVTLSFAGVNDESGELPLVDANVATGDGDDTVAVSFTGIFEEISVGTLTGEGNDAVATRYFNGFSSRFSAGRTQLGPGDDAMAIAGIAWGGPTMTMNIDGGDGNDTLNASFEDTVGINLSADTGAGDDSISVRYTMFLPDGTPNRFAFVDLTTGDGSDRIDTSFIGNLQRISLTSDTGAGPDSVGHEIVHSIQQGGHSSAADLTRQITVVQDMGPGDDKLDLSVGGLSETEVNLKVLGSSGDDTIHVDSLQQSPPDNIITGPGVGGSPLVKVFDSATLAEDQSFFAYGSSFLGGVRVAAGDVNGDGIDDVITGAGTGGSPHVKVFDGVTSSEIRSFFAYDPGFTGGVFVASGDVNGDGFDDIITGTGSGSSPHVKVFDGRTGTLIRSFFAYDPGFTGGVTVAAGDINNDGVDDIITGAGPGSSPHVKVFDGNTGTLIRSFFAYDPSFAGGVYVASGDLDGDGIDDIVTGAGEGSSGGHVEAFSGKDGSLLKSFFAFLPTFTGGARVAVGDVNSDGQADIIAGAGPGGGPVVRVFDGSSLAQLQSFFAYIPDIAGGVYVAAGDVTGRPSVLNLVLVAGDGDDHAAVQIEAHDRALVNLALDMGTGSDRLALDWRDPTHHPTAKLPASLLLTLGGADAGQTESGDEVVVAFEHGDVRNPLIIGTLWDSHDSPPSSNDAKSLHIAVNGSARLLDWSSSLTGGSNQDSVQLYFQGKLKVSSDPLLSPRLSTSLNLGDGDNDALIDLSKLDIDTSTDLMPITVNAISGTGDDVLSTKGTDGDDVVTVSGDAVLLKGVVGIFYENFGALVVDGVEGDDSVAGDFLDFDKELTLSDFEKATMKVTGDFPGSLTVNGPLQKLIVGGVMTGSLSVDTLVDGLISVLAPTGKITVDDTLENLLIDTNLGTISAGDIHIVSARNAAPATTLLEDGIVRTIAATALPGQLLPATFGYYFDGTGDSNPRVTLRVSSGGNPNIRYDLALLTDTVGRQGSGIDLAGLYSSGPSGIRNITVAGNLTPDAANPAFFGLAPDTPGGVQLPLDTVGSAAFAGNVTPGGIAVNRISAVAFGSANGVAAANAGAADAAGLLGLSTRLLQAAGIFNVLAGDGTPVVLFLMTSSGGGFARDGVLFTDQILDTHPVSANIDVVSGKSSQIRKLELLGEGVGLQTKQPILDSITVLSGSLGDLILLSSENTPNITAPRIIGSLDLHGTLSNTIQTTAGDIGRALTDARGIITGVTSITLRSISQTGRIISAANLVSFVDVQSGMDGVIAVQGNFGVIQTDDAGNAVVDSSNRLIRLGGLEVLGGLDGAVVVLGNFFGDLSITGGLDGRIAVKGAAVPGLPSSRMGILGHIDIHDGIRSTAAIVSGGRIGDASSAVAGADLDVTGTVEGILAAGGDINFGSVGNLSKAAIFENATGVNKTMIDAIFTDQGAPLSIVLTDDLTKILTDLYALKVGKDGKLIGPKP